MNRLALARRAFDGAVRSLERDRDAGLISPADASVKYGALYAAYQQRKQDLELGAFLARHGLKASKHFEKLDRTLAEIERPTKPDLLADSQNMVVNLVTARLFEGIANTMKRSA